MTINNPMTTMIEERLRQLRAEYARGEQQMAQLDQQRRELHETMLRISGAILVLEELAAESEPHANGTTPATEVQLFRKS
jgi:hypothetical protein